jgi:glycosyltransferase involved in cell wall biosynthesis
VLAFACGTPHGGALASTLALAELAAAHGHDVHVIAPASDPYSANRVRIGAAVRAERVSTPLGRAVWRGVELSLRGATRQDHPTIAFWRARDVPAAIRALDRRPDAVIVNSMRSLDIGRVLSRADRWDAAAVWYLRETSSLAHLPRWSERADALVANSQPLAAEATIVAGRSCAYVPSHVDTDGLVEPAVRTHVVLVNPIGSHGLSVALAAAESMPDVPFALQESWPLSTADRADLERRASRLANVEVRSVVDRSEVFRDAAVLLAPHTGGDMALSRPRVAVEAQHLGIPVVATDQPGLRAVVTAALLVPVDAPISAWVDALRRVLGDYERHVAAARRVASTDIGLDASAVWRGFEHVLDDALSRRKTSV